MKPSKEPKRFALGASSDCRTVTVDGVSIAYDDRGAGFPVIGLHAITHGSRDFEHVADGAREQVAIDHARLARPGTLGIR